MAAFGSAVEAFVDCVFLSCIEIREYETSRRVVIDKFEQPEWLIST
jgi:hypothetical protein